MELFYEIQIKFCIEEWSSKMFIKAEFNKYDIHLADLTQWCSGNPIIVDNI